MPPPLAPVLTLDAALDGCGAGVVRDGLVLASRSMPGGRGSAALLPSMAAAVLQEAGLDATGLRCIAVTIGPGSFTGVRAALALAQGIGLAAGVPVIGVTVGNALRGLVGELGRPLWVAVENRRGRIFLDREGSVVTLGLDAIPLPGGPIAIAGDAAIAVASRLLARGGNVRLLTGQGVQPAGIAAGAARWPAAALPLYVDPPAAHPNPPARPAPAG